MKQTFVIIFVALCLIWSGIFFLRQSNKDLIKHNEVTNPITNNEKVSEQQSSFPISNLKDILISNDIYQNRKILNEKIGQNYISEVLNGGFVIRWNEDSFPLKIYVSKCSGCPEYYETAVYKAFEQWNVVTDGYFTFKFVQKPENADIRVSFIDIDGRVCSGSMGLAGLQSFSYTNNLLTNVSIKLYKKDCSSNFYRSDLYATTVMHEIGHVLGLGGHSPNENDLMYSSHITNLIKPSVADINTLRILYSIIPDITNAEISEVKKSKLVPRSKIW